MSDSYLGQHPGDLDGKPYATYWNPDMRGLSSTIMQALAQSPRPQSFGFPAAQCGRLEAPGYLPLENGYTQLDSGEMFVAVLTPMPGISGAMIDWWFAWHSHESQRYKLWHPQAHMKAVLDGPAENALGLADRERYIGSTSYVDEYIGDKVLQLAIQFRPPEEFGLSQAGFSDGDIQTAICAHVGLADSAFNVGKLVHLIRNTADGCEMRSRFWLGKASLRDKPASHLANRLIGSRLVSKLAMNRQYGHDMVVHCAMEMAHLASFLPALYDDYH